MSGGFHCDPVTTRVFVSWPPGADVPHARRLEVSKFVAAELEGDGLGHQFDYSAFVIGIADNKPAYHIRMKGIQARAREMAGCDVQIWVAVTTVQRFNMMAMDTVRLVPASATEIGRLDMSKYGGSNDS
jgi:hypothetical protein